MLFLILALLSSALVSLIMRFSENKTGSRQGMLAVNYLMCTLLSLVCGGSPIVLKGASAEHALWLGILSGVFYLAGFVLLQYSISKNGVVLSSLFMKLGVLVPFVVSMLLFHEIPGVIRFIGMAAALAGIIMISGRGERISGRGSLILIALLLAGGSCDVMAKVFEQTGDPVMKGAYLFFTFLTALVLCSALAAAKRSRLTLMDVLLGSLIGIPNYFSSHFLLWSLEQVPAVIAYPTYSIGALALITMTGCMVFHEKLSRRQAAAMVVIIAALILLSI